jgi:hypothetical protein
MTMALLPSRTGTRFFRSQIHSKWGMNLAPKSFDYVMVHPFDEPNQTIGPNELTPKKSGDWHWTSRFSLFAFSNRTISRSYSSAESKNLHSSSLSVSRESGHRGKKEA